MSRPDAIARLEALLDRVARRRAAPRPPRGSSASPSPGPRVPPAPRVPALASMGEEDIVTGRPPTHKPTATAPTPPTAPPVATLSYDPEAITGRPEVPSQPAPAAVIAPAPPVPAFAPSFAPVHAPAPTAQPIDVTGDLEDLLLADEPRPEPSSARVTVRPEAEAAPAPSAPAPSAPPEARAAPAPELEDDLDLDFSFEPSGEAAPDISLDVDFVPEPVPDVAISRETAEPGARSTLVTEAVPPAVEPAPLEPVAPEAVTAAPVTPAPAPPAPEATTTAAAPVTEERFEPAALPGNVEVVHRVVINAAPKPATLRTMLRRALAMRVRSDLE